jgi:hypothetical protein
MGNSLEIIYGLNGFFSGEDGCEELIFYGLEGTEGLIAFLIGAFYAFYFPASLIWSGCFGVNSCSILAKPLLITLKMR